MQEKIEKSIKIAYKKWKADAPFLADTHPDEEAFACFLEGKLPPEESDKVKAHLIKCEPCAEIFAIQVKLRPDLAQQQVPVELLERVKALSASVGAPLLEIILSFKEKAIEILNTTGDILVGRELIPAPVLRSRKIKDFKDEVNIFKDVGDIRVEVKIENKNGQFFNLTVIARHKQNQEIIKDLRVSLFKEERELESRLNDSGKITFEHVLLGKYTVELANLENKVASILLEIKI